jgi:antitoxin CptB
MDIAHHPQSRWSQVLQALRGAVSGEPEMDFASRINRARFRAWHRGTREADYMIGSYFDHHHTSWGEEQLAWFETILEEDDVDVMSWALKAQPVPDRLAGKQMTAMQRLDYIKA